MSALRRGIHKEIDVFTLVSVVGDLTQVNEVCSYGDIVNLVGVSNLDLDAFAEGREHLCEDDLLVPSGLVAALLNRGFSLQTQTETHDSAACMNGENSKDKRHK